MSWMKLYCDVTQIHTNPILVESKTLHTSRTIQEILARRSPERDKRYVTEEVRFSARTSASGTSIESSSCILQNQIEGKWVSQKVSTALKQMQSFGQSSGLVEFPGMVEKLIFETLSVDLSHQSNTRYSHLTMMNAWCTCTKVTSRNENDLQVFVCVCFLFRGFSKGYIYYHWLVPKQIKVSAHAQRKKRKNHRCSVPSILALHSQIHQHAHCVLQ